MVAFVSGDHSAKTYAKLWAKIPESYNTLILLAFPQVVLVVLQFWELGKWAAMHLLDIGQELH